MNVQQLDLFETLAASSPAKGYDFGGAKEYYAYHEHQTVKNLFDKIFNMDVRPLTYFGSDDTASKLIMVMLRRILIDMFKFDDELHRVHGNYEEQGKCMKDVILENYGKDGLDLVMALTNYSTVEDESVVMSRVKINADRTVELEWDK
jgi:hypothetical protein